MAIKYLAGSDIECVQPLVVAVEYLAGSIIDCVNHSLCV